MQSGVGAGVETVVKGDGLDDFGNNFLERLKSGLILATAAEVTENFIGQPYHASQDASGNAPLRNDILQIGGHFLVGCAAGQAISKNCVAGGAGAAFGELGAEWTHNANLGRIIGSGAGFILSDGDAEPVNIANLMASNAVENNFYKKLIVQKGSHAFVAPMLAIGETTTYQFGNNSDSSKTSELVIGSLADAGMSIGISGDDKYSGITTFSYGYGRWLGIQATPSNSLAAMQLPWYDPQRYINVISFGIGYGKALPVTLTVTIPKEEVKK